MPEITESKMPKTVNEALKILAYNEFFWDNIGAYKSRPKVYTHPKDRHTVLLMHNIHGLKNKPNLQLFY